VLTGFGREQLDGGNFCCHAWGGEGSLDAIVLLMLFCVEELRSGRRIGGLRANLKSPRI